MAISTLSFFGIDILFDYLACHSRLAQSVGQIGPGIEANSFYRRHANNAMGVKKMNRGIYWSAVKLYVQRLRLAIEDACQQVTLKVDAHAVLLTQETATNETGYRLRVTVSWVHFDTEA